jgi:hypothetical protein
MTDINTLLDLLAGHQWAALSASILMIALAIGRRLAPVLWTYIPAWARPIPLLLAAGIPEYKAQIQLGVAWPVATLYALMFGLGAIGVIGAVGGVVKRPEPKVRGDEPPERTRARKLQRDDRSTLTERSPTLLVLLALVVMGSMMGSGCAGSFEESRLAGLDPQARAAAPPPTERCQSLDDQHRWLGGVAKGSAFLAGASGIATWPVDNERAELGLAIGAGVMGATAVTAEYLSSEAESAWVRECP